MALPRNLDMDLLRAFVAIAEARNISRAANALLRNQSTISLQLKRLEEAVGHRLCDRNPRAVRLTKEGEGLLAYALQILRLNDEAVASIKEPEIRGVVRLGAPEDFATTHLPEILGAFARSHPLVSLEVTCDFTLNLMDGFRRGAFDIALVKREPSVKLSGVRVWREPLVWVGADGFALSAKGEVPLVVSPEPCVYRKRALDALQKAKRSWRIAYTCGSLAGNLGAVAAGLGVSVLPKDMAPKNLKSLATARLPKLKETEIALISRPESQAPVLKLCEHIVASLEKRA